MPLNRRLDALWLHADVSLCGGCAAVLQKTLHQGDVVPAALVDLGGVPFTETVSADPLITQIIADNSQLLLDRPCGNRKHQVIPANAVTQAIVLQEIIWEHYYCSKNPETTMVSGFLFVYENMTWCKLGAKRYAMIANDIKQYGKFALICQFRDHPTRLSSKVRWRSFG